MYRLAVSMMMAVVCAVAQTPGTVWGGAMADEAAAMTRDAAGHLYVVGTTYSPELAAAGGGLSARKTPVVAWGDVFVQKMTAEGVVEWRAVFGGSGLDRGRAVALDAEGNVFVAGLTQSSDFPVTENAYQPHSANGTRATGDGFLVKLAPDGSRMVFATYFGGGERDEATSVGVDALGQAVVGGDTYSDDLPTTGTSLQASVCAGYGYDGWVAKFNVEGTGLLWGTYLCGSGHDHVKAMTVDRQGAVYVAGETASADFPVTKGAAQESKASALNDGFVVKLGASGHSLEWGTFYGGVESEWVHAMAVKGDGQVVIGGETRSSDLPGAGAAPAGMTDGFVAQMSADGKALAWARLLGGAGDDRVTALSADADGRVWLGGWTTSSGWYGDVEGREDGFVGLAAAQGEGDVWIARLGGRLRDRVLSVRWTPDGAAAAGWTEAAEWLGDGAAAGAGQSDAFVALVSGTAATSVVSAVTERQPGGSAGDLSGGGARIPYAPRATVASGQRWMVELKAEPAAAQAERWKGLRGMARAAALTAARGAARAGQTRARTRLEAAGGRVYGSVDLIANVLFVEADAATAERMRQMDEVKRVMPVRRLEPELDTSLSLHRVGDAWARIGGWDQAGAGMKIGIMDTGVEVGHPMMADPGLAPLEGYPRGNREADLAETNGKVIVARGYLPAGLKAHTHDDVGHGTTVASIAGGSPAETELGTVAGVAPFAYIGNYKIMTNEESDLNGEDLMVTALEDAAADGMDVVNLSLHTSVELLRPEDDIYTDLFERLASMGTMVVKSTGNEGPSWSTLTSPHVGEWGLMVGSHQNGRVTVSQVSLTGGTEVYAKPGANTVMSGGSIDGEVVEVQQVAPGTWGCSELPAEHLTGRIALIDRGGCTFAVKGENARQAGAVAMVVMALAGAPEAISMGMGAETLPAFMVSYEDGQTLRARLAEHGGPMPGSVSLTWKPMASNWEVMSSFSSNGPVLMEAGGIKPDLVATGSDVWAAKAAGGYGTGSGTSFSAPHVTGAVALVKGARPGLDGRQYRSLIINSAEPLRQPDGRAIAVMKQGAGRLNVDGAVSSTVTVYPTSLHMGTSQGTLDRLAAFRLQNIGVEARVCALAVEGRTEAAPVLEPAQVEMEAGGETWVVATWQAEGLAPGQYDGHIRVRCEGEAYPLSIPYWHGVRGTRPDAIQIVKAMTAGAADRTQWFAFEFRITDEAGLPMEGLKPAVTVTEGTGKVVETFAWTPYRGIYGVHVVLGTGWNTFQISYGGLTKEVSIEGQ